MLFKDTLHYIYVLRQVRKNVISFLKVMLISYCAYLQKLPKDETNVFGLGPLDSWRMFPSKYH